MMRAVLLILAMSTPALAQRPLFDPDDFVDPRQTAGRPVLISRIVVGGASNLTDSFRPLGGRIGFVHLANSFYWGPVQFDYKRSEMRAESGPEAVWEGRLGGSFTQARQTRAATPSSKDTLHVAWYWPIPTGGGIPVMLRSRATFTTHEVDSIVMADTVFIGRMKGRERTYAVDTDTWFRIAGRDVYGLLSVSDTKTTRTLDNRNERALTYTNRFPAFVFDRARVLIRPTLTVGGISNRCGSAINLVNPAIEIFRPFAKSGANLHVIWSPQWSVDGGKWETKHQVAVVVDRALFVKMF